MDLTSYYQSQIVSTYFQYTIKANGKQKKIFTVLSDETDSGSTNRYFYDGDESIGINKKIVKGQDGTDGTDGTSGVTLDSDVFSI